MQSNPLDAFRKKMMKKENVLLFWIFLLTTTQNRNPFMPLKASSIILRGILRSESKELCMLEIDKKTIIAQKGEVFDGYALQEINESSVKVQHNNSMRTISL